MTIYGPGPPLDHDLWSRKGAGRQCRDIVVSHMVSALTCHTGGHSLIPDEEYIHNIYVTLKKRTQNGLLVLLAVKIER